MQAEHDQRGAAEAKAHQQDFSRAEMIRNIADRGLGQAGTHGKNRQRETELDIADIELLFQEGKQHRQYENMEMTHPVGNGYSAQCAELFVLGSLSRCSLLRCGQNIGHFGHFLAFTRENIGPSGYLSMNMAAWQPSERGCLKAFAKRLLTRRLLVKRILVRRRLASQSG